jgi:hypothetical protein
MDQTATTVTLVRARPARSPKPPAGHWPPDLSLARHRTPHPAPTTTRRSLPPRSYRPYRPAPPDLTVSGCHVPGAAVGATTCGLPRNLANVLTMAVAYLCLFTAFQTTQILAAALLGNLGTIAVGTLYLCFVGSGFFAPVIARKLGPVRGLVLGGCTYVLFMVSFIYMVAPVVLVCACIIGCGASILWCSQGMMLTQCTNDTNKATYSSLFWGIFNLCVIPGNVVGHFLLMEKKPKPAALVAHMAAVVGGQPTFDDDGGVDSDGWASLLLPHDESALAGSASHGDSAWSFPMVIGWDDTKSPLFIFLAASGVLGTGLFFCLKTPDSSQGSKVEPLDSRPVSEQIFATIRLMFKARMVCLLPLFLFSGIEMTMWSAWFTRQMYKTEIGLVMVVRPRSIPSADGTQELRPI